MRRRVYKNHSLRIGLNDLMRKGSVEQVTSTDEQLASVFHISQV